MRRLRCHGCLQISNQVKCLAAVLQLQGKVNNHINTTELFGSSRL